jgi:hypothetical protein
VNFFFHEMGKVMKTIECFRISCVFACHVFSYEWRMACVFVWISCVFVCMSCVFICHVFSYICHVFSYVCHVFSYLCHVFSYVTCFSMYVICFSMSFFSYECHVFLYEWMCHVLLTERNKLHYKIVDVLPVQTSVDIFNLEESDILLVMLGSVD